MGKDFLQQLGHLGFTARIKRLNERVVSSTLDHYSNINFDIEPNWHVIFLLLKQEKSMTVTAIAQTLGFSHPAMIKITRKMQNRGYLTLSKDASDGRKTQIQLSDAGIKVLPHFEKEWFRIQEILQEIIPEGFLEKLNQLEHELEANSFKERYQVRFGNGTPKIIIRNARPSEFKKIGQLMVKAYASLEGFPQADEMPEYYNTLTHIGDFTKNPETELLVAVSDTDIILGGVLYFSDMQFYGSKGLAPSQKKVSGFRLLAVAQAARGMGVGKALSLACIAKAKANGHPQILIHSTDFMKPARKMYKKLGFKRSPDLDFEQNGVEVYGYRLNLD